MNSKEIIGKEFALDLGSTPVQIVVKNITKDKVIVEYKNSTPGRVEEFNVPDFEYLAMVKITYNQEPINDVYKSYVKSFFEGQLKENYTSSGYDFDDYYYAIMDVQNFLGWPQDGPISQKEFIDKIKTDDDFSKTWGLKIEERELDMMERWKIADLTPNMSEFDYCNKLCDEHNVPTKLITITYNNETIESYE